MSTKSAEQGASTEAPATSQNTTTTAEAKPAAPSAEAQELAALKAQIAAGKQADKAKAAAAQADLEKSGELAKALEAAKARLAELEAVEPLAAKWTTFEAAETKRLDDEVANLPDNVKALYSRQPDLESKRDLIAAFKAAPPSTTKTAPAAGTGTPAGVSGIDFAAAFADPSGQAWAAARAADPKGADAFISGARNPAPAKSGWPFLSAAPRSAS
jgi:small-conductance mechanosensitive channel